MRTRVTTNYSVNQALLRSQTLRQQLELTRAKITANKSILKASEAPGQIFPRASLQAGISKIDADIGNIEVATTRLNQSNQIIRNIISVVTSAKNVALAAEQGPERALQAGEVDAILRDLLRLANSSYDGEYLFSGAATDTIPYSEVRRPSDGKLIDAVYSGSSQHSQMVIHGAPIDIRYPGTDVFQLQSPTGNAAFLGVTGIRMGQGVGNATGIVDVLVKPTGVVFDPGSGIASGTLAATGNTIVGRHGTHKLQIIDTSGTGASGTVSLNGGTPVPFTNANNNLMITGPRGEVIYVDTTNIVPGFSGELSVVANGTVSIDAGATNLPLTFSADEVVTNADGTRMVNLDTSNVVQAGSDAFDQEGTANLFQTVAQLREDLLNTRQLSETQVAASIQRRIGDLQRHIDQLGSTLGEQAITLENLDGLKTQSEDLRLGLKESLSTLEDADLVALAVALKADETRLQYSFAAMSSIFDVSLLNFIR